MPNQKKLQQALEAALRERNLPPDFVTIIPSDDPKSDESIFHLVRHDPEVLNAPNGKMLTGFDVRTSSEEMLQESVLAWLDGREAGETQSVLVR